jgi:D-amino-acid dehydrogenase
MTADCFVLALGSYSPLLARTLGYRLPVYPVKGYSITVPIRDPGAAPSIGGVDEGNLIVWSRLGERMRFTATAEFAGYHLQHQPRDFEPMLRVARELFPDCADYSQPAYWAGLRPMTPEGTPILGKTRHLNLYLNTGHGHLGWTWSCGTARVLTDIIRERVPGVDLTGLTLRH